MFYVKHRTARAERQDTDSDRLEDPIIQLLTNILLVRLFVIAQHLSSAQLCFGDNAFKAVSKVFRAEADAQLYLTS